MKRKKEGIGIFNPFLAVLDLNATLENNRELWESVFQLGKKLLESCKAQMLRHKKVSCPGGGLRTVTGGTEGWWVHHASVRRGSFAACRNPSVKTPNFD